MQESENQAKWKFRRKQAEKNLITRQNITSGREEFANIISKAQWMYIHMIARHYRSNTFGRERPGQQYNGTITSIRIIITVPLLVYFCDAVCLMETNVSVLGCVECCNWGIEEGDWGGYFGGGMWWQSPDMDANLACRWTCHIFWVIGSHVSFFVGGGAANIFVGKQHFRV